MVRPWWRCTSTDLEYQHRSLERIDKTLSAMLREGIPRTSRPYVKLFDVRGMVQANLGFKIPRNFYSLLTLYGFSPGTIQLWHDDEMGFMTEARVKPGAPPVYTYISDEVAMTILKGELTKELETRLMTPDDYIGE